MRRSFESLKFQKEHLERELKKHAAPSASCISSITLHENRAEEQNEMAKLNNVIELLKANESTLRNQLNLLQDELSQVCLQHLEAEPGLSPPDTAAIIATCERKKRGRQVISYVKEQGELLLHMNEGHAGILNGILSTETLQKQYSFGKDKEGGSQAFTKYESYCFFDYRSTNIIYR